MATLEQPPMALTPAMMRQRAIDRVAALTAARVAANEASRKPRVPYSALAVQAFLIFEFLCQLALLVPGVGPLRVPLRSAAFGASLLLIAILRRGEREDRHPASWAALCVMVVLALSLFHPNGNTAVAAIAQVCLYGAILAPLLWVPRAKVDPAGFRRVILTLWAIQTASAAVGVVQTYFPGKLQPPISTAVEARGADYVNSLRIRLADGEMVFRPMGLTDQPGGAATAGLYAAVFGLGLLLCEKGWLLRACCVASMAIGLLCLYLSQVRSVLVMAGICMLAFCVMLALRRDFKKLLQAGVILAVVIGASFAWAVSIGGATVINRLQTLVANRADDVYYQNRGHFLEDTFNVYLPEYPCGAGLGRWGMTNQYFGNNGNPSTASIWVEIQWTGWVLDGGIPLVVAYVAALAIAFYIAWKIARDRDAGTIGVWAALVLAYNLAALAVTFNYPLFIGQSGLEFWLLNSCLFAAYQAHRRARQSDAPAAGMQAIDPAHGDSPHPRFSPEVQPV